LVTRVQQPRQGPRLFATPDDEPRARRASDVVVLVACSLALVAAGVVAEPPPGFGQAVTQFLSAIPDFLDGLWQILADLLALAAVLLVIGTLVRRRWSIARDQLLSLAVATGVWFVVGRVVEGTWPSLWDSFRAASPPSTYPSARISLCTAVVLTTVPHLTRPVRRLNQWLMVLGAFAVAVLGATTALGAIAGLLVGAVAAAAVHLAAGSSGGRPPLKLVRAALEELGVRTTHLEGADRQQAGLFVVHATAEDGARLVVKVYGRDAYDAALLSTLWRTVWYREAGSPLRFGRLLLVEYATYLTLLAGQAIIATDQVVSAGVTADYVELLVLSQRGRALTEIEADECAELLPKVWSLVRGLQDAGIAHGCIDSQHLMVQDQVLGVVGFRGATVAPTQAQRHTDEVQALVTTALLVDEEHAVTTAAAELGADRVAAMLPYLQSSVLSPLQRRRIRAGEVDLDRLRAHAAEAAGTEPPPLMQLRRVTIGSIVRVALPALAVVALISAVAGLDLAELREQPDDTTWWLVALGFALAQLPRVTQATATLGASPVPLPLGPVYALQLAVSYVNLAIPTSAARVAVNVRFFQRHGVPAGSAIATGAIDGFAGFVVQAGLLIGILLFTPASLDLDLRAGADSASQLGAVVVSVAVVAVLIVGVVGRWRRFVLGWARRLGAEAWDAVRGLRDPRRLALLVGGNLMTEIIFATALATFARALGFPVGIGEALLINIAVGLLAGLLPIPGGIGVTEGGLTFGLVQAGMPEESALVAVLLYRVASFYLPPVWGYFALRWLERNEHI
jgi:uncharacterized membrane protein YbhN (UPF0104 family)